MRSVMTHQFTQVPQAKIERSVFDRSFGHKTTFDAGYLIPIFLDEILPGDSMSLRLNYFARLSTPQVPIMDNLFMDTHFFFVPSRILWSHWKNLMGEKVNPSDTTVYTVPYIATRSSGQENGDIYDYLGIPVALNRSFNINALPLRAINKIWNEWYRDQNLQNPVAENFGDGPDLYSDYTLLKRGKRKDYFTGALPWPQKGDAVSIPLGTSATVNISATAGNYPTFQPSAGGTAHNIEHKGASDVHRVFYNGDAADQVLKWASPGLTGVADLSTATAQTINALRQAFQLQRLLERDARGGTRYVEMIKSHFGVTSPDFRQQRPEYLGGGTTRVNIHPIPRTNTMYNVGTDNTEGAVGQLGAMGTASAMGNGFTKSFTEHGYVLGFISARADLMYAQGLDRLWTRSTRFDFYFPALAHLGEQTILQKEIYMDPNASTNDNDVFGYQERFAEYRYKKSMNTGLFGARASAGQTIIPQWHLMQIFSSAPTLNTTFIQENPPVDRVIAVTTEPHFVFDGFFQYKCARPMPVYSVPGMIDHF